MFRLVKLIDPINNIVIAGGLVPKGAYENTQDYTVGDSVDYNGSSYVMFNEAASGVVPTNTTFWQVIANKGDTGATGSQGDPGIGVPSGGTTGQILAKSSNTNFDTGWIDNTGSGSGVSESLIVAYSVSL